MEQLTKHELEIIEVALVHYFNGLRSDKFGREERHHIRTLLEKLSQTPSAATQENSESNIIPGH